MNSRSIIIIILLLVTVVNSYAQSDSTQLKKKKSVSITGIPIISYNKSYGYIFGANGMAFFNLNKKDTISPSSQAGLSLGYTQNKSWFGSAFTQLYINENRWRVTFALGTGDINFQYFEANNESDDGSFVDYSTVSRFLFAKGLRRVAPKFYVGALLKLQHSTTEFANTDSIQKVDLNGIGLSVLYDTRNYVYYPTKGIQATFNYLSNAKWIGSDSVVNSIRIFANFYHQLSPKGILAARASIFAGLGEVPFVGQHTVGGKDIRGYTNGKYRGNQVYSVQGEYRYAIYKRWGAVGFFGLAFTEMPYSGILPGGGVGIRFKAIPSKHINIGLDGAIGKGDHGIYLRINEAF